MKFKLCYVETDKIILESTQSGLKIRPKVPVVNYSEEIDYALGIFKYISKALAEIEGNE